MTHKKLTGTQLDWNERIKKMEQMEKQANNQTETSVYVDTLAKRRLKDGKESKSQRIG